jgi:fibronectin type 3 domain-containing protein
MKTYFGRIIMTLISIILLWHCTSWAATIQLAWDRSTDSTVEGYNVYYGTQSRQYGEPVNAGNVTEYLLTVPGDGKNLYFAVTAYNASNVESDFSEEVNTLPPGKPTGLKAIIQAVIGWLRALFGLSARVV